MDQFQREMINNYKNDKKIKILSIKKGITNFNNAKKILFHNESRLNMKKWSDNWTNEEKKKAVIIFYKKKLIKNNVFIIKLIIPKDDDHSVIGEKILTKEKYDLFKKYMY